LTRDSATRLQHVIEGQMKGTKKKGYATFPFLRQVRARHESIDCSAAVKNVRISGSSVLKVPLCFASIVSCADLRGACVT